MLTRFFQCNYKYLYFLVTIMMLNCMFKANGRTAATMCVNTEAIEHDPNHAYLINYLKKNIRYPLKAVKNNQEFTLFVTMAFSSDGNLKEIEVSQNKLLQGNPTEIVIASQYLSEKPNEQQGDDEYLIASLKSNLRNVKLPKSTSGQGAKQYIFKVSYKLEK